ncbi:ArnT family glycosyltransferase [Pseudanabaena yagii]|uniref:Glycosyltransferase RgtA/B/C/D-like domain-containing protein n=1 Tax=Pseudanabaena yagii GIHE-NHR1 TaxID=2722753 RepID=A0ABX1LWH1_9CYAN|nr:hypothetical protein [Pseudanabaena yagii]NMF59811.1 hypothetical protein [Pseudanabaena yagii GIHE-NHR1]
MQLNISKLNFLSNKKPWLVFIFFTLLVVVLRWSSFYRTVIDWDESLYLLVAKAWADGNPPYTAIWDNKPPGIYLIFLAAITTLGHSVIPIRIFACVFIATTSFFLSKIGSLVEKNGNIIGLLAGVLYAIATLSNGGLAANTEIFFTTFVAIAIYIFFSHNFYDEEITHTKYTTLFGVGFLLGIAFEIKYVVLFDFIALSLILMSTLIFKVQSHKKYWLIVKTFSVLILGFTLPFIAFSFYFWVIGHFDEYFYANFTANKLRTIDIQFSFIEPFKAIYQKSRIDIIIWLSMPFLTVICFSITKKNNHIISTISVREKWLLSSLMFWMFTILMGIYITLRGSFYGHYFIQVLPILCFVVAYILINLIFGSREIGQITIKQYMILGFLLALLIGNPGTFRALESSVKYIYFRNIQGFEEWGDTAALISKYLKNKVNSNDYIYVVNEVPIVYFLTNTKTPTRYAFPPFLFIQSDLPNITGVEPHEELDLILQKRPLYIIKWMSFGDSHYVGINKIFLNKLDQALSENYQFETSIDNLGLYRLKNRT